jgi:hypothetical protein
MRAATAAVVAFSGLLIEYSFGIVPRARFDSRYAVPSMVSLVRAGSKSMQAVRQDRHPPKVQYLLARWPAGLFAEPSVDVTRDDLAIGDHETNSQW